MYMCTNWVFSCALQFLTFDKRFLVIDSDSQRELQKPDKYVMILTKYGLARSLSVVRWPGKNGALRNSQNRVYGWTIIR
jgi:hypothetical protein